MTNDERDRARLITFTNAQLAEAYSGAFVRQIETPRSRPVRIYSVGPAELRTLAEVLAIAPDEIASVGSLVLDPQAGADMNGLHQPKSFEEAAEMAAALDNIEALKREFYGDGDVDQ